jgi:hypothetical protein
VTAALDQYAANLRLSVRLVRVRNAMELAQTLVQLIAEAAQADRLDLVREMLEDTIAVYFEARGLVDTSGALVDACPSMRARWQEAVQALEASHARLMRVLNVTRAWEAQRASGG